MTPARLAPAGSEDGNQAAQTILTAISPYVVGLFAKRDTTQLSWEYATGVPIEFDGLKFILTAAHVLSCHPVDFVFVPPPPGGFRISDSTNGLRYATSARWDTIHCVGNEASDLAAILFRTPPQIPFFRLSRNATTPPAGIEVVICGYPFAKKKDVESGNVVRDLALPDFQCARLLNPDSLRDLKPHQFAIDYPLMSGIVRPVGFSGSMVWYDGAGCRTLEELREGLSVAPAGIITEHWVAEQALFCTKIETVVGFVLREVLPVAEGLGLTSTAGC